MITLNLNQLTCYIPLPSILSSSSSYSPPLSPLLLHLYTPLLIATMPSLRRTSSHPTLRSSPYGPTQRSQHPYPHRRSSGPETTRRRILADIDWWTVSDGQVPAATEFQTQPVTATQHDRDENVHVEAPVPERTQSEPPAVQDVEELIFRGDSPVVHTTISVSRCQPTFAGLGLTCYPVQFQSCRLCRALRRPSSCPPCCQEAHSTHICLPHLGNLVDHRL